MSPIQPPRRTPGTILYSDPVTDLHGREGLSSPIRRASEMAPVGEIFQVGLRATASARIEEVAAAHA